MREMYWNAYVELRHKYCYYKHYQLKASRFDRIISGLCTVASASSIAGWGIWSELPLLWGIILAASQLLQALKPLFPFSKQLIATQFLIPDIERLLLDVEFDWRKLWLMADEEASKNAAEISELIQKYQVQYLSLTSRFVGNIYWPYSKRCDLAAELDNKRYFDFYYSVKE